MKYSDKRDVVLLIRLRHLPRFRDGDRWRRMVSDIGIDDEGNALRNLFTLVSDTRSTHSLSRSNVSVSDRKVAKTLFGGTYLRLWHCVELICFQWLVGKD